MLIGVAGPYSADTEEQRQKNLDAMNFAAAKLLEKGHTPLIGVNAALPVIEALEKLHSNSTQDLLFSNHNVPDKSDEPDELDKPDEPYKLDKLYKLNKYEAIMKISLAVISNCDALLLISESPGANRERDLLLSKGGKIYYSIDEVPDA